MTDTRKYIEEQFDQFFEFDTDDRSTVTSASCRFFAEHCIEQLLAVIAKKDEAITHALREHGGFTIKGETERICRDALAIKPENVGLVECGVIDQGSMIEWNPGALTYLKFRTKLYTIKTKGGNDANFG